MTEKISSLTRKNLIEAIQKARLACELDENLNYEQAIVLYKQARSLMESELGQLTKDDHTVLSDYMLKYQRRIDLLQTFLPKQINMADKKTGWERPLFPIEFEEEEIIEEAPEVPPQSVYHRPYWMMRILAKTMSSGGFLTSSLYVPHTLWYQSGIKFTAIQVKYAGCETTLDSLLKLKDGDINDSQSLSKDLLNFCTQLDAIQNTLARHLSFVPEIKKGDNKESSVLQSLANFSNAIQKGVSRLGANVLQTKIEDDTDYIQMLLNIFEHSQYIELWLTHYETKIGASSNDIYDNQVLERLRRIGEFFYSVVCAFVIRDFNLLLERYLRKSTQSFTYFLPEKTKKPAKVVVPLSASPTLDSKSAKAAKK